MGDSDFIRIIDDAYSEAFCNKILTLFNRTIDQGFFAVSKGISPDYKKLTRDDIEVNSVDVVKWIENNGLSDGILPREIVVKYYEILGDLINDYMYDYSIDYEISSSYFKIHQVEKGQGYHAFHTEQNPKDAGRILAYMTYIQEPEEGGETEFLYQSKRIDPKIGKTLIWPAQFTHPHRGNPVLSGVKTYVTGWYEYVL